MRRLVFIALLVAAPAAAQTAFTLPDTVSLGAAERAIVRFEQARSAAIARHDTVALRRMYADEFRGVTARGLVVDRERLLGVFAQDDPSTSFAIDEMRVQALGAGRDAAVLTARLITLRRSDGAVLVTQRFTHAYAWRDGRWQIVAAQGTVVP